MALTRAQAAAILHNLGWRVDTTGRFSQAVRDFQSGWNLGVALGVDGLVGPATAAALLKSEANRRAGRGTASAHFSFSEFACSCGGRYAKCRRIWIVRRQVQAMERYRVLSGPLAIVSGCRCPERNAVVHGASSSQHLYGTGCDFRPKFSLAKLRTVGMFVGIGVGAVSGLACHGDTRIGAKVNWTYPGW